MDDNGRTTPDANNQTQPFRIHIQPRKQSLTERLVGQSRSWINSFYTSQEKDDQLYGQGFNDPVDDLAPNSMFYNAEVRRRRNSSVSSDTSDAGDSLIEEIKQNNHTGRVRTSSISERVAGMQLHRKPHSTLEGYAIASATVIDDQT